jgi:hypothetical protein
MRQKDWPQAFKLFLEIFGLQENPSAKNAALREMGQTWFSASQK